MSITLPVWITAVSSVILLDLAIYFQHVLFHAVPALWRLHIGGEGTVPDTNASRNVSAIFGEINLPLTRQVEVTGAVRWDHYSDVGSKASPQVRARWNPSRELLLRASAGKGFRAPSLWDLHSPPAFGNTANAVTDPGCPANLIADEDALRGYAVERAQHRRDGLKPETSTQWSVARVRPQQGTSIGLDYWRIEEGRDQHLTATRSRQPERPRSQPVHSRFKRPHRHHAFGFAAEACGQRSWMDVDEAASFVLQVSFSFIGTLTE
jgi:hypothetical protein